MVTNGNRKRFKLLRQTNNFPQRKELGKKKREYRS